MKQASCETDTREETQSLAKTYLGYTSLYFQLDDMENFWESGAVVHTVQLPRNEPQIRRDGVAGVSEE